MEKEIEELVETLVLISTTLELVAKKLINLQKAKKEN